MTNQFRLIMTLLLVMIGLAFLANLSIDNPYSSQVIRSTINEELKRHSNLKIDFKALSLNLLPLGVDIYGLDLKTVETETLVASAARIQVDLSITSLLLGKVSLGLVKIHELQLNYPFSDEVRINSYPSVSNSSLSDQNSLYWPPNIDFPISNIVLIDSTVKARISDKSKPHELLQLNLEGLNIDAKFSHWQDWEINFKSNRSNLSVEGQHLLKDAVVKLKLSGEEDVIKARDVFVESQRLKLLGSLISNFELEPRKFNPANKRFFDQKIIGFRIRKNFIIKDTDLGILGDYLKAPNSDGLIDGKGSLAVHIPLDDRNLTWNIKSRIRSKNARLAGFKLLDSESQISIDSNGILFEKIELKKSDRTLAFGKGRISFNRGTDLDFEIKPYRLAFSELLSILQVEDFQSFESQLSSKSIILKGKASPFQLDISGPLNFLEMRSPKLPKSRVKGPDCSLNVHLAIDINHLRILDGSGFCHSSLPSSVFDKKTPPKEYKENSPIRLGGKVFFENQKGIDLRILLDQADSRLLKSFTGVSTYGLFSASAHFHGAYDQMQIDFAGNSQSIWLDQQHYQQLNIDGQFDVNTTHLSILNFLLVDSYQGVLDLSGSEINFMEGIFFKGPVSLTKISKLAFQNWLKIIKQDIDLSMDIESVQGFVEGRVDLIQKLNAQIRYNIGNLYFNGEQVASNLTGDLDHQRNQVAIKNGYARLDLLELNYDIKVDKKQNYRSFSSKLLKELDFSEQDNVRLTVHTIQLPTNDQDSTIVKYSKHNHLSALPFTGSFFEENRIGANIILSGTLEGTIKKLEGQFQGSLQNIFIHESPIASVYFSGFVKGSQVEIPILKHSGNALVGRLSFNLSKPGVPYEWFLDLAQFDFRALLGPYFAKDPRNYAYLSATWNMKGQFTDWWNSSGSLEISHISVTYLSDNGNQTQKIEMISDQQVAIIFREDGWYFKDGKSLKLQGDTFRFELYSSQNNPPENLNLGIKSSIDLRILRQIFPQLETARGQILVEGIISGSIDNPNIQFTAKERKYDPFQKDVWEPLSLGLTDFAPAFTNLNVDVAFDNGILKVNRIFANKGKQGTVLISGNLDLANPDLESSRLLIDIKQAEFNRLEVPLFNNADLTLSGSLYLTGQQFPFDLNGQIKLDKVQSIGNFDLRKQIVQTLYRKKYAAPVNVGEPIFNIDIQVEANRSIYIKNRNMEATLSADLKVQGNESEPIILGQIQTEEGNFAYKRTFDIRRGIVSFEEPTSPPDPKLDIIGTVQVDTYNVEVIINGTAAEPKISFNIDPPNRPDGTAISKVDIIMLLTSGQLPQNTSASPIKVASNEALSLFVGFAEGPLEKIFDASGQTFVRQVYIDSYFSETESRPITRLNLPININEDLRLVFQVDDEGNFKPSFQYSFHENIALSGSIDKKQEEKDQAENRNLAADTVVDLKFRFKFE